jgi:hypothetical protein
LTQAVRARRIDEVTERRHLVAARGHRVRDLVDQVRLLRMPRDDEDLPRTAVRRHPDQSRFEIGGTEIETVRSVRSRMAVRGRATRREDLVADASDRRRALHSAILRGCAGTGGGERDGEKKEEASELSCHSKRG